MAKILHMTNGGRRGGIENLLTGIIRNSTHENVYCALFENGPILDDLLQDGHVILDFSPASVPNKIRLAKRAIREEEFDVIIGHNLLGTSGLVQLLSIPREKQYIQFFHFFFEPQFMKAKSKYPGYRAVGRRLIKRADCGVAVSRAALDWNQRALGYFSHAEIIYNAIDYCRFQKRADLQRPLHDPVRILYLGRLEKVKGVQFLLKACAELTLRSVDYDLTIAGWGSYENELKSLSNQLGVRASFAGEVSSPEEYYASADLFVHSAIYQEGFGIAPVEAMAAGCICIASDAGALPEVIEDGYSGFLVRQGSAEDIADRIQEILKLDNKEQLALRANASKRAESFSLDKYIAHFDSLVDSVIGEAFDSVGQNDQCPVREDIL